MSEETLLYHQQISLPYRYTAGRANTDFLQGLAEGKILGTRCAACGLTLVPSRPFCPECSGHTNGSVEVADEGELVVHTIESTGRIVGRIRLDGADTDLVHIILTEPGTVSNGLRVRARWGSDRGPEITAIEGFEPIA